MVPKLAERCQVPQTDTSSLNLLIVPLFKRGLVLSPELYIFGSHIWPVGSHIWPVGEAMLGALLEGCCWHADMYRLQPASPGR